MKYNRKTLKEKIRMLEVQQVQEKSDFYNQIKITFDSLKPLNLLRSTIRDFTHHKGQRNNIFEALIPLLTNLISGRVIKGHAKKSFSKIIATIVQMGLTTIVARHSHTIFETLSNLIDHTKELFNKVIDDLRKTPEKDSDADDSDEPDQKKQETASSADNNDPALKFE